MKRTFQILFLILLLPAFSIGQTVFELDPQQSMCITGKGPGQDGAINPYRDQKSIAVVKNLEKTEFSVRIQYKGDIVKEVTVEGKKKQEFVLEKGYILFLDNEVAGKAKVSFRKYK